MEIDGIPFDLEYPDGSHGYMTFLEELDDWWDAMYGVYNERTGLWADGEDSRGQLQ